MTLRPRFCANCGALVYTGEGGVLVCSAQCMPLPRSEAAIVEELRDAAEACRRAADTIKALSRALDWAGR